MKRQTYIYTLYISLYQGCKYLVAPPKIWWHQTSITFQNGGRLLIIANEIFIAGVGLNSVTVAREHSNSKSTGRFQLTQHFHRILKNIGYSLIVKNKRKTQRIVLRSVSLTILLSNKDSTMDRDSQNIYTI